jgi:tRNA A-37 threonylcarbamoyl transferase component Bud32
MYKYIKQLGNKGRDGVTYLVKDENGKEYALKTFGEDKSRKKIVIEYLLQKRAADAGIAPKVYYCDLLNKRILMERMDSHLVELLCKERCLTSSHKLQLFNIFKKLDEIGILHNDSNLCNYMLKGNRIYLIDYGFSIEITEKMYKQGYTNASLMCTSFFNKLEELSITYN